MNQLRIAFAGDRDIAVWVLRFLRKQGVEPYALMISAPGRASHASDLVELYQHLDDEHILVGDRFRSDEGIALLRALELDYIVSVHFPYIVPEAVLALPRVGVLNLHPAYLPFNRGWHTPSWAILEGTPAGATLHFMDKGIDTGAIVHRKQLEVSPGDTADTLYTKLKQLEFEVFREGWQTIERGTYRCEAQDPKAGTTHKRDDLLTPEIQLIDLDEIVDAGSFLRRLRALTTNRVDEAAYFVKDGKRYRVQITIHEEPFANS